ncbi:MAG: glycerate kinase [Alistipes sp.]|nr:glycerate kinase [Alistipes sp.]
MRLLLAFDKFKHSLSSDQVAEAFSLGWRDVMRDTSIDIVPISDGGDGLLGALVAACSGEVREVEVNDPLRRRVVARYALLNAGTTAVIESSEAAGLRLLAEEERNPLLTTTFGVGEMILDALQCGCRRIILGLGGSATNDCGMGLLSALGARFYDAHDRVVEPIGAALESVARVDFSMLDRRVSEVEIIVASDVVNPLYGPYGAACVYAPQKGADGDLVEHLDRGMRTFATVVASTLGRDLSQNSGAGAAGGMGYALMAFLRATLLSGIDLVLDMVDFDRRAASSDLIVTGEGRIDRQTLMGKAPSGVLSRSLKMGRDVIAVGGCVEWCDELRESGFKAIYEVKPPEISLQEALKPDVARENIRNVARAIAREYCESR